MFAMKIFAVCWTFKVPVKNMLDVVKELATAKFVKRPTDVMLGCAAWDTTRATVAFATFPETDDPWTLEIRFPPPEKYVAVVTFPET